MNPLLEMMSGGGVVMWPLLMLAGLGGVAALALALMGMARIQVPAALWLAAPLLLAIVGELGTMAGMSKVAEVLALVSPEQRGAIAAAGYAETLYPRLFAQGSAAAILIFSGLLAGVCGSMVDATGARSNPGIAAIPAAVCAMGGAGIMVLGVGLDPVARAQVGAALVVGGLGLGLASLRAGGEHAGRLAEIRLAAALCVFGAPVLAALMLRTQARLDLHSVLARVAPDARAALVTEAVARQDAALQLAAIAGAAGALAAALALAPLAGALASPRLIGSLVAALLGAGAVSAAAAAGQRYFQVIEPQIEPIALADLPVPAADLPRAFEEKPGPGDFSLPTGFALFALPSGRSWTARFPTGETAALPAESGLIPLIIAPAATPARDIAAAGLAEKETRAILLARRDPLAEPEGNPYLDYLALRGVPLGWRAPEAWLAGDELGLLVAQERPEGVALLEAGQEPAIYADIGQAGDAMLARLQADESFSRVTFVPGERWTAQTIADLCGYAMRSRETSAAGCEITAEIPGGVMAALRPAPAEVAPAEPGLAAAGSLDRNSIIAMIKAESAAIRACYEVGLARDPTLAGKVVVRFTIGGDGAVSAAETAVSTLADAAVESCLEALIARLHFPATGGESLEVSYPFTFQPQ